MGICDPAFARIGDPNLSDHGPVFHPDIFRHAGLYYLGASQRRRAGQSSATKSLYLNVPFFSLRAILYFAVWISLGYFLPKWSARTGSQRRRLALSIGCRHLSGPGLVLYGLTVTFSAIDWPMSLEPHWYSTIFGMIFMVSDGLIALAFVIGVAYFLSRREPLSKYHRPVGAAGSRQFVIGFRDVVGLYVVCQFLIIWVENLKNEIPWYLHRMNGGWGGIAVVLDRAAIRFAVYFVVVARRQTQSGNALRGGHRDSVDAPVELFWFVAPAFHPVASALLGSMWRHPSASVGFGLRHFCGAYREGLCCRFRDPRFIAIVEEYQPGETWLSRTFRQRPLKRATS